MVQYRKQYNWLIKGKLINWLLSTYCDQKMKMKVVSYTHPVWEIIHTIHITSSSLSCLFDETRNDHNPKFMSANQRRKLQTVTWWRQRAAIVLSITIGVCLNSKHLSINKQWERSALHHPFVFLLYSVHQRITTSIC